MFILLPYKGQVSIVVYCTRSGLYCCLLKVRFLLWSTSQGLSLHSTELTPEGWSIFNQSLYFVSMTKRNWTASRDDCLQRNADLVVINNKVEEVTEAVSFCVCVSVWLNVSISQVCVHDSSCYSYLKQKLATKWWVRSWIGLRLDRDTEGTWKWVDGTNVTSR